MVSSSKIPRLKPEMHLFVNYILSKFQLSKLDTQKVFALTTFSIFRHATRRSVKIFYQASRVLPGHSPGRKTLKKFSVFAPQKHEIAKTP